MTEKMQVPLFDLIMCLSSAMDLVSPAVVNHHKQVAYIAYCIADEFGLPEDGRKNLVIASVLHDVGAFYLKERLELLHFESHNPHYHADCGHLLLKTFTPLIDAADLIRFHHVPWNRGEGNEFRGDEVQIGSHLIHLADRIAVLIDKDKDILGQVEVICDRITGASETEFIPDLVDGFMSIANKESFWLDSVSPSLDTMMIDKINLGEVALNDLSGLTKVFARIIDFRSEFTATHSSGVAATAEAIAKLVGFSDQDCQSMRVAGYLHDVGKLAVATEILEKPASLSSNEMHVMRSHTYHTYWTLDPIEMLDEIKCWAAYHHEHLDGSGYPFHIGADDLSNGARIMAVADVFTAITEDRPYRKAMSDTNALKVLQTMSSRAKLDPDIVSQVGSYFSEINSIRHIAQQKAEGEHRHFLELLERVRR